VPKMRKRDEVKEEEKIVRQADKPCDKCGSWYRISDYCRCGNLQPVCWQFYTVRY